MRRSLIVGAVCFTLGAITVALAATGALRPDEFIARAWTWSGIQSFNDGKLVLNGSSSGSSTVKAPATGGGTITLPTGTGTLSTADVAQSFTKPQRVKGGNVAISVATFTFDLSAQQDFEITLVNGSCPCTIANPTNISAAASDHQHGVIIINQSSTGSDTIGTWGSQWVAANGTATLSAITTTANARDVFSYDVIDSTHIMIAPAGADVKH